MQFQTSLNMRSKTPTDPNSEILAFQLGTCGLTVYQFKPCIFRDMEFLAGILFFRNSLSLGAISIVLGANSSATKHQPVVNETGWGSDALLRKKCMSATCQWETEPISSLGKSRFWTLAEKTVLGDCPLNRNQKTRANKITLERWGQFLN